MTCTYTRTRTVTVYANPYIACAQCRQRAAGFFNGDGPMENWPCEHNAGTVDLCPSWGPVDGCTCAEMPGGRTHGEPTMPPGFDDLLEGCVP